MNVTCAKERDTHLFFCAQLLQTVPKHASAAVVEVDVITDGSARLSTRRRAAKTVEQDIENDTQRAVTRTTRVVERHNRKAAGTIGAKDKVKEIFSRVRARVVSPAAVVSLAQASAISPRAKARALAARARAVSISNSSSSQLGLSLSPSSKGVA